MNFGDDLLTGTYVILGLDTLSDNIMGSDVRVRVPVRRLVEIT